MAQSKTEVMVAKFMKVVAKLFYEKGHFNQQGNQWDQLFVV